MAQQENQNIINLYEQGLYEQYLQEKLPCLPPPVVVICTKESHSRIILQNKSLWNSHKDFIK